MIGLSMRGNPPNRGAAQAPIIGCCVPSVGAYSRIFYDVNTGNRYTQATPIPVL